MTDESQIIFLMAKIEFCGVAKIKRKKQTKTDDFLPRRKNL